MDGLDLHVPRGGVHGFLGPNGSGKTTTIRMLLGLVRADAGSMWIFGQEVPRQLPHVISQVGAIVESPKFFLNFSARHSLELLAGAVGTPRERVGRVLEQTGLSTWADDRFGTYSLGMKQRLAVAATLLKEPDLLIFDEPTNGLDPAGIHDVRTMMRDLANEGRTVFLSSHLLTEVEQVADTVSIIGDGRLIAAGTVAELIGEQVAPVRLRVSDPDAVSALLYEIGLTVARDNGALVVQGARDAADLNRYLAERGHYVRELVTLSPGLESVFLRLTHDAELGSASRGEGPRSRRS